MRATVFLIMLLSLLRGAVYCQQSPEGLGDGLMSLKVVATADDGSTFRYVPSLMQFVDASGAPQPTLQCLRAQGVTIVSGYLLLSISESDVRELTKRVKQKYGSGARVEPVTLSGIELNVKLDGQSLTHLGPMSWPSSPYSIQFDVPTAQTNRKAMFETRYSWTESEMVQATINVNWEKLAAAVAKKEDASNQVADSDIRGAISRALEDETIVLRTLDSKLNANEATKMRARANEIILQQFKEAFLSPASSGTSDDQSGKYTLRSDKPAFVLNEINFSISQDIPKQILISREINICK